MKCLYCVYMEMNMEKAHSIGTMELEYVHNRIVAPTNIYGLSPTADDMTHFFSLSLHAVYCCFRLHFSLFSLLLSQSTDGDVIIII